MADPNVSPNSGSGWTGGTLDGSVRITNSSETSTGSQSDSARRGRSKSFRFRKKFNTALVSQQNEVVQEVFGSRTIQAGFVYLKVFGTDLHGIWVFCEGEIDEIVRITLDGKHIDNYSTVTSETYTGTMSQTVCGLNSVDEDFTDPMIGTAYIYLKLPSAAFSDLPVVEAYIRGKKLYDPRTGETAYSENPVLALRHILTDDRGGQRIDRSDIDEDKIIEAADFCDESFGVHIGDSSYLPDMTSNTAPKPYVISADEESGGNAAWKAFNGQPDSYWETAGLPNWIKVDLKDDYKTAISRVKIQANGSSPNDAPGTWTFEGSNNDSDWDVLHSVADNSQWAAYEIREFEFENTTVYRYYRIQITDTYVSVDTEIGNIWFYNAKEELRYSLNLAFNEQVSFAEARETIENHFLGSTVFDKKYRIEYAKQREYDTSIGNDDIISMKLRNLEIHEVPNKVVAIWTNLDTDETEEFHIEDASIISNNVEPVEFSYSLPGCLTLGMAQRIGMYYLNLGKMDFTIELVVYDSKGLDPLDVFRFSHDLGFNNDLFQVQQVSVNTDGSWLIIAGQYNPLIHRNQVLIIP